MKLTVIPRLAGTGRQIQSDAVAYTRGDVDHVTIQVFQLMPDNTLLPEASIDLQNSQLDSPVTFDGLSAFSTYRVVCTAFSASGQVISDALPSTTQIVVADSDVVGVSLQVKLLDYDFAGSGSATLQVIDGTYVSSGPVTLTVATPTPTPVPQFQVGWQDGGTISPYVVLNSVSGAQVGSDYLLSLDWQPGPMGMTYWIRWGIPGNQYSQYLGEIWPAGQQYLIASSAGAGTLSLTFQGTAPTSGFPLNGTVSITSAQ